MAHTTKFFHLYSAVSPSKFLRRRCTPLTHKRTKAVSAAPRLISSKYRRSTHPTSVPLNKLFSNAFPLSVSESFADYKYRKTPLKFQHDLLATLPFYPDADSSGRTSKVIATELKSGNFINEFVIYPPGKSTEDELSLNHLILIHGYGGGLGFFLNNFSQLATVKDWCIHAVDLLGYGCSSRPPFKLAKSDLEHVEGWFHDSHDEWLQLRGLHHLKNRTMVMAHSMGAYLMATYGILRDPHFCKKLLMVSPGAVIKHRKQVPVPGYFAKLWERNYSPFSLVRNAGPLGSKLVSGWSSRRFANLPRSEAKLLHKYAYGIFQSPGSGEYMLNYLLAPGADARYPLVDRGIHKLDCDLLWVYGKEDWMDKYGGELCSDVINNYRGEVRSKVVEVENSGHHVYLDNSGSFNALVLNEMEKF